jgi:hypothetical protein
MKKNYYERKYLKDVEQTVRSTPVTVTGLIFRKHPDRKKNQRRYNAVVGCNHEAYPIITSLHQ